MPASASPVFYEVELVLLGTNPRKTAAVLSTPEEVLNFLNNQIEAHSVLVVVCMKNGADFGNYIAYINELDLAHVRVLEHRGFYATTSSAQAESRSITFQDESGNSFTVEGNAAVSLDEALNALKYWLPTQKRSPSIVWGEE